MFHPALSKRWWRIRARKKERIVLFQTHNDPPSSNILESRLQIKWAHKSQLLKLSLMLWRVLCDKLGISSRIESILSSLPFSSVKLLSNWGWVVKRPVCAAWHWFQWLHMCHISHWKYKARLRDKWRSEVCATQREETQRWRYGEYECGIRK